MQHTATGRRRLVTGLLVGIAALLMAACAQETAPTVPSTPAGQPGAAPAGQPAAEGQPKRGGTLTGYRLAQRSEYNYDMFRATCCSQTFEGVGEPLLLATTDGKIGPNLAESWTMSSDGLTFTLKLRQGVKFHNKPPANGREMEAKDIVATYKYLTGALHPTEPKVSFPRSSNVANLTTVEAVDKYTVKMTLSGANADFLRGLAEARNVIIPDGLLDAMGGKNLTKMPDAAIGTGPFSLETFDDRSRATWKKFPEYWDKAPDGKPYPYLDAIVTLYPGDHQTALAAMRAKQIDISAPLTDIQIEEMGTTNPELKLVGNDGGTRKYILMNFKNGQYSTVPNVWKDVRVRKALFLMVDQCKLGKTLNPKTWRLQSFTQYWFPESRAQEEFAKMPGFRCEKDADRKEAVRLLTEAGYPKGFKMVDTGDAINPDDNVALAADLNEAMPKFGLIEFRMETKLLESAASAKIEEQQLYDIRYDASFAEPTTGLVYATDWTCKGGRNYSGYCNPEFDKLWQAQQAELDPAKRKQMLLKIEDFLFEEMLWVPMFGNQIVELTQPYVKGYAPNYTMAFQPLIKPLKWTWVDK